MFATRSWLPSKPPMASGRGSAQRLTASTAVMYGSSCTSFSSASVAAAGAAMATPGWSHSPNSFARRIVSSTRTGAIGWPGPK